MVMSGDMLRLGRQPTLSILGGAHDTETNFAMLA